MSLKSISKDKLILKSFLFLLAFLFTFSFCVLKTNKSAMASTSFTHSHYIRSTTNMYNLGYNESNVSGLIILDFGCPASPTYGLYGTIPFDNVYVSNTDIKIMVQNYINGFNANSSHTASINLAVGTSNYHTTGSYKIGSSNFASCGYNFATMIESITYSSHIIDVNGAIDAEIGYDNISAGADTRSFITGYSQSAGYSYIYDYGDDAGGANPVPWTPDTLWYVAYGSPRSAVVPEIYYTANANAWQQMSLWAYNNKSYSMTFVGVMSENGASGTLSDLDSYNALLNALQSNSHTYQLQINYGTDI
jgi:hypothetical protein